MFLSTYFCSDKIREAHNKPFVYRALLPFVAKTTANIIPNKIKHEMKNYIDPFNVVEKSHNYMGNTAMAIMLALIYFSLVGFVYSFICLST
jgi:hypothetical protein